MTVGKRRLQAVTCLRPSRRERVKLELDLCVSGAVSSLYSTEGRRAGAGRAWSQSAPDGQARQEGSGFVASPLAEKAVTVGGKKGPSLGHLAGRCQALL